MAKLYLEDLKVGDRFKSAEHVLDAAQIKAFAQQFDPQPFHTDEEAAKSTFFGGLAASGWHTAALTMKLLVESGLPLADGIIGSAANCSGPSRRGPATCCMWRARSSTSCPRAPNPAARWWRCAARRSTSMATCSSISCRSWWCRRVRPEPKRKEERRPQALSCVCESWRSSSALKPARPRASKLKGGLCRGAS